MTSTTNKYITAKQVVRLYLNGNMSESDFKRRISDIMSLPLPKSKEQYQIESILNSENLIGRANYKCNANQCKGNPSFCDCASCLKIKGEW